jgi:adenosylcobinamide-GDP ribazoletransferase
VTGRLAHWVGFDLEMLRASAAHFPGVGWLLGAILAAFSWLLLALLSGGSFAPLVVAACSTMLGVLITGAFHEDGLADVADGLGGSMERERALEIMKDSRVGAFGAIAICLVLVTKISLLGLLGQASIGAMVSAIFLAHVVSRTCPLFLIRLLPHVGDLAGSKSKPLADQITGECLGVAIAWCLGALLLYFVLASWLQIGLIPAPWHARALAGALALSALTFVHMWRWFARRLQGFTGDCLGATQQLCELAFYLGWALCL